MTASAVRGLWGSAAMTLFFKGEMAERARFELARPFSLPAFQASALDQAMRPLHISRAASRDPRAVFLTPYAASSVIKSAKVYVFP